jgi:hypothetical protein
MHPRGLMKAREVAGYAGDRQQEADIVDHDADRERIHISVCQEGKGVCHLLRMGGCWALAAEAGLLQDTVWGCPYFEVSTRKAPFTFDVRNCRIHQRLWQGLASWIGG